MIDIFAYHLTGLSLQYHKALIPIINFLFLVLFEIQNDLINEGDQNFTNDSDFTS